MAEAKVSDMDLVTDLSKKPRLPVSETRPEGSQKVSGGLQNLPGVSEPSRGQVSVTPSPISRERWQKVREDVVAVAAGVVGTAAEHRTGPLYPRNSHGCIKPVDISEPLWRVKTPHPLSLCGDPQWSGWGEGKSLNEVLGSLLPANKPKADFSIADFLTHSMK